MAGPEYFLTPFMVGLAWKNSAECFAVSYLAIKKIWLIVQGKSPILIQFHVKYFVQTF